MAKKDKQKVSKYKQKASLVADKISKTKSVEEIVTDNAYAIDPDLCQWAVHGTDRYAPTARIRKKIPTGTYKIGHSQDLGHYLQKQNNILSDQLIQLPIPEIIEIVGDIEQFWKPETKKQFNLYDLTYKRGIIVWGSPGNGKSMMMQLIIRNLLQKDGIILTLETVTDVELFVQFASTLRKIEPTRPLVVILEDIDNVVEAGHSVLSALMNILDGVNQIDNVVYLATTNYPEKLQERISNRPSRFDRKYEITEPSAEVRRAYILGKMRKEDIDKQDIDLWVKETDGYSLSHIKELIVSVCILGKDFKKVLEHFSNMKRNRSVKEKSVGY